MGRPRIRGRRSPSKSTPSSLSRAPLFTPFIDEGGKTEQSLIESTSRLNIWEGSVRSGKTIASILRWLHFVHAEAPANGELVISGKTSKAVERNILDPIINMLGPDKAWMNRGTGEFWLKDVLRPLHVISANDESAQEKIRGMTMAGMYGDEITLWPESFFKMALSRLSVRGAKFFGTTNPDSPYHWLKVDYLDRKAELNSKRPNLLSSWHFKLEDNKSLDPDYIAALKLEYTGLWFKRFIEGLWVLAEGAVYDMWDEKLHVVDVQKKLQEDVDAGRRSRPKFRYYFTAADYGTNNPTTFGLFGHDGKPPVYLIREYFYDSSKSGLQKTDSQYGQDFEDFVGPAWTGPIYVDPSALSFISELRHRGYRVSDAKNEVIPGIRFVASMLSQRLFFVDISCRATIQEFSSYVWDMKAQQRGEDKPLKQFDHTMDRTRYALYTHFFKEHKGILQGMNYR